MKYSLILLIVTGWLLPLMEAVTTPDTPHLKRSTPAAVRNEDLVSATTSNNNSKPVLAQEGELNGLGKAEEGSGSMETIIEDTGVVIIVVLVIFFVAIILVIFAINRDLCFAHCDEENVVNLDPIEKVYEKLDVSSENNSDESLDERKNEVELIFIDFIHNYYHTEG